MFEFHDESKFTAEETMLGIPEIRINGGLETPAFATSQLPKHQFQYRRDIKEVDYYHS